jgi:hypothetical protein
LNCPETFEIDNPEEVMKDGEASNPMDMFGGMMGGMGANEDMVMAMHMNNGMNPGLMNAENLGSG